MRDIKPIEPTDMAKKKMGRVDTIACSGKNSTNKTKTRVKVQRAHYLC